MFANMDGPLPGKNNFQEVCRRRAITTATLLDYANRNRHCESFNDVVISAGNNLFPANKLVLSFFSSFFEKMFKVEMKEKYQNSVEINCVDGNSMNTLIEFIYTGNISINNNNVCELLSASDYLQMEEVKQFCFDFLSEAITPENCFAILSIADRYFTDGLRSRAIVVIVENLEFVSNTTEFKQFSKEELSDCVSRQSICHVNVETLFTAILKWTKHNEIERATDFPYLVQLIDFEKFPYDYFNSVILKEDLVSQDHSLCQFFLKVQGNRLEKSERGSRILTLGGQYSKSKATEVFNCVGEAPLHFPDIPESRYRGSSIALKNHVWYIGGLLQNSASTDSVWRMKTDEKEKKWEAIASMNEPRYSFGSDVFNESLVVVGGYKDRKSISTAEIYSPVSNTWNQVSAMTISRGGNAVVTCKGRLYSIGGDSCGLHCLAAVERLSSINGNWENVQPMQTPRAMLAAVFHNGFIYAIGGRAGANDETRLKSVERYDPSINKWIYVAEMNFRRSSCSACVLRGNIFVFGGFDETKRVVNDIECYIPLIDKWTIAGRTNAKLVSHSVVVL